LAVIVGFDIRAKHDLTFGTFRFKVMNIALKYIPNNTF